MGNEVCKIDSPDIGSDLAMLLPRSLLLMDNRILACPVGLRVLEGPIRWDDLEVMWEWLSLIFILLLCVRTSPDKEIGCVEGSYEVICQVAACINAALAADWVAAHDEKAVVEGAASAGDGLC